MSGSHLPNVDNVQRARRMARHRQAQRLAASPQLELPGMAELEKENAREQPGVNHETETKGMSRGFYRR